MERRTFLTSLAAFAVVASLPIPAEAEAAVEVLPEFYNASWDPDFLELPVPEPDYPYRPIAPHFPVRLSWFNEHVLAKVAPGSIIYGWKFIADAPLIVPKDREGISITSCHFKAAREFDCVMSTANDEGSMLQIFGTNISVTNCYFDCDPG